MSTLSPGRIECEVDLSSTGQATKLAQQLIAVHRPCIAVTDAVVKGGPLRSDTADG